MEDPVDDPLGRSFQVGIHGETLLAKASWPHRGLNGKIAMLIRLDSADRNQSTWNNS
jgi:Neuraminidase (sialidase)